MKQTNEKRRAGSTKSGDLLPKTATEIINGGLYMQRVRCGKDNCKCARGERHTAFYFFTRVEGKLVKLYVRKKERVWFYGIVRRALEERAATRKAMKQSREIYRRMSEELRINVTAIETTGKDNKDG